MRRSVFTPEDHETARRREHSSIKRELAIVFATAVCVLACGSTEYVVIGSAGGVGTEGLVEVEELDGGNLFVHLELDFLAPPARVQKGASQYVVWFVAKGQTPYKAGRMSYDPTDRRGRLSATYTERRFELLISAEKDDKANTPSSDIVLRQTVDPDA